MAIAGQHSSIMQSITFSMERHLNLSRIWGEKFAVLVQWEELKRTDLTLILRQYIIILYRTNNLL